MTATKGDDSSSPDAVPMRASGPVGRSSQPAISVRNVCKAYRVYEKPVSIVSEVLFGRKSHREKRVLQDINLEIQPGEVVGVIGRNGAGKSTLLKLIAGTLAPSTGKVQLHGRVSAILELGTGFNPLYSGRDNVIMSAIMRGMPEQAIKDKFDSIVAFAGLADVIDQPFQTYSSGMQARLAFAAAVAVEADVIIIDEALAAGDIRFTARSLRRIREICESGVTALFVSHQTYHVMQLCSRAIWIDEGRIKMDGPPIEVCRAYEYQMHAEIARDEGRLTSNVTILPPPGAVADATPLEAPMAKTPILAEPPADARIDLDVSALEIDPPPPASVDADSQPVTDGFSAAPQEGTAAAIQDEGQRLSEPGTCDEGSSTTHSGSEPISAPSIHNSDPTPSHFQSDQYRITRIEFLDKASNETRMFRFGETFRLRVSYESLLPEEPEVSCGLAAAFTSTPDHQAVMYFNTNYPHSDEEMLHYYDADFRQYTGRRGVVEAIIPFLQVKPGNYLVSLGILPNQPGVHEFYEYHHLAFPISVLPNGFPEPSVFYAMVEWQNGPCD